MQSSLPSIRRYGSQTRSAPGYDLERLQRSLIESICRTVGLFATLLGASIACAHSASTAYLQLFVSNRVVAIQLELPLRDLDDRLGLDANNDGRLTWGELHSRAVDVIDLVRRDVTVRTGDSKWELKFNDLQVSQRGGEGFAVLGFATNPAQAARTASLSYHLFFAEDPLHRCLVALRAAPVSDSGASLLSSTVLSPERDTVQVELGELSASASSSTSVGTFFREGTHHIWTGYDHLLFLLALLLPAVLRRTERGWEPVSSLKSATVDVLTIVTAFTIAHSLTLALAAFEVIRLPPRVVESTIAASIIVAALANLWPRTRIRNPGDGPATHLNSGPRFRDAGLSPHHRLALTKARKVLGLMEDVSQGRCMYRAEATAESRSLGAGWPQFTPWKIAFVFGLIHGFGFAGVLSELGLQRHQLAVPIFGFNLGVEFGQLVCVALFLPLAFWLRSTRFYRSGALPFGSLIIIALAGGWFVERAFNLGFMPI